MSFRTRVCCPGEPCARMSRWCGRTTTTGSSWRDFLPKSAWPMPPTSIRRGYRAAWPGARDSPAPLAIPPDLLLMAEPFVSLDGPAADRLRGLLVRLVTSRPVTVLFVTHELGEAVALADRVLVLSPAPGRIVAEMPIPLPRERRQDGDTLAALRTELARLAGIQPGRSSLRIPSS